MACVLFICNTFNRIYPLFTIPTFFHVFLSFNLPFCLPQFRVLLVLFNVYESLFLTKMIDNILSMLTEPAAAAGPR